MERSLTTSSHSPLTLPYLTLKYSRLEVQPSKFGRSLLIFDLSNNFAAFLLPAPAVPESALPIGMEKEDGSTQLIPIEPSEILSKLELWDSLHLES